MYISAIYWSDVRLQCSFTQACEWTTVAFVHEPGHLVQILLHLDPSSHSTYERCRQAAELYWF